MQALLCGFVLAAVLAIAQGQAPSLNKTSAPAPAPVVPQYTHDLVPLGGGPTSSMSLLLPVTPTPAPSHSGAGRRLLADVPNCDDSYFQLSPNQHNGNPVSASNPGECSSDDSRGQFSQDILEKFFNDHNRMTPDGSAVYLPANNVMGFAVNQQSYHWAQPGNSNPIGGPNGLTYTCQVTCLDTRLLFQSVDVNFQLWAFTAPTDFWNDGDGGFINWCFTGWFNRNDKHVAFLNGATGGQ